ncbi:MAG: hypothetical protein FIA97_16510 [Methylococcaceae bacterium]|nr:hypothetical protein [Methylococcaceae bacterium]
MRTFTYLGLLPLAWFGAGVASIWLALPFAKIYAILGQYSAIVLVYILAIAPDIIKLLILYRVLSWIKSRSLYPPNKYVGFYFVFGVIITASLPFIAAGYIYLMSHNTSSIPTMPPAFALNVTGVASAILIFICEIRDFYSLLPGKSKHT